MGSKKIAFVFPGQGSQSVGMLQGLSQQYPLIKQTFAEASELLKFDAWEVITTGPAELLDQTENTQPLLFTASVALWRIWCQSTSIRPLWLAGHSVGEYAALVCAGSLSFADGVCLTKQRGICMQRAVPMGEGAMAAIIGLNDEVVEKICNAQSREGAIVVCANYNCPGQVVIAGHARVVEATMGMLKDAGAAIVKRLSVSVPSHTPLMKEAAIAFRSVLEGVAFQIPSIAVISNADLRVYREVADIRDGLYRQLYHPVRWTETVLSIRGEGCDLIYECGPGKVLAGLIKRIDRSIQVFSLDQPEGFVECEGQ